jgi:AraC-like DNA-binding protein
MKVAVDVLGAVGEPFPEVNQEHTLGMLLHPGFIEMGRRRSAIKPVRLHGGEIRLCTPNLEQWFGSADLHLLTLDSVEQALAVALVNRYAVRRPSPRIYRGGLTPARLRRIIELVAAKIDDDLTLEEMAESVELSRAHFSQMFRKSTCQSPHQFVLRHRVERAKEILRTEEVRVLDVAIACGFKTQQHFARVFRQMCGISPGEYRQEFLH